MNRGIAIAFSIIVVVVVGCVGLFLYWMSTQTEANYDLVAKHWNSAGRFTDYANDTGVKDISDIVYYVDQDRKRVQIVYGYVNMSFTFKEMNSDEWKEKLAFIGITYDIKPETFDDFRLYWNGEAMDRCATNPTK